MATDYEVLADLIYFRRPDGDDDLSREGEVLQSILRAAYAGTTVADIVAIIRDAYVCTDFDKEVSA